MKYKKFITSVCCINDKDTGEFFIFLNYDNLNMISVDGSLL